MTGPEDEITAALVRTLRRHAGEARPVAGLPEQAVVVAARRRRRRVHVSIAAVVALAVGVPVAVVAAVEGGGTPPAVRQVDPTWRWESYRGVEVPVPPDWEYGVPGWSWCSGWAVSGVRPGAVGRPGYPQVSVGCSSEFPPVGERQNWLTFDSRDRVGERRLDGGWVEETRRVNGVFVTIFTDDDALRAAVLGSARPIAGTDHHGCPVDTPATEDGYRPDRADGGLPPSGTVESISVCRYVLAPDTSPPLLSSSRIAGDGAREVVDAILAAPEGVGPDGENASLEERGTEIIVLRVEATGGGREVVMRYSGRTGNGFDDGTTRHQLTAVAISPLLTGANRPGQLPMPVADLLFPR